ncbi:sensor domain-containing diguanylate cyclase [Bdellovibrionota bacterium FG-1]
MTQSPHDNIKKPSELAAYSDLFERLLDATFLLNPESYEIIEANAACEHVLGIPENEIVGHVVTEWAENDCQDEFNKALRITMRRYYPRQFETRWKLKSGKVLNIEVHACPLDLGGGNRVLQIIARDITFRREAEAKMRALLEEVQVANGKLEILSTVDDMTQLYNFRYFKTELGKEHTRSNRYRTPYAIIFCDVDHFKKYNDRNGHPAGDQLLREFAALLKGCCRTTDQVARYGGEEFAVICPGIDFQGAQVLAERIRTTISQTKFAHGEHQPLGCISVSIGYSSFPDHGKTAEEILKAADEGVYLSKAQGRNRVSMIPPVTALKLS